MLERVAGFHAPEHAARVLSVHLGPFPRALTDRLATTVQSDGAGSEYGDFGRFACGQVLVEECGDRLAILVDGLGGEVGFEYPEGGLFAI